MYCNYFIYENVLNLHSVFHTQCCASLTTDVALMTKYLQNKTIGAVRIMTNMTFSVIIDNLH